MPAYDPQARPGDNLYTNSVVALNIDTGKLAWYHQFIPGESFNIFNPVVLDLLDAVPALRGDPDLGNTNLGITVLWLK